MSTMSRKTLNISVALLMIMSGVLLAALFIGERSEETVVDAAMSKAPDEAGYLYVDNLDPEPKIDFEWIDATTKGEYLEDVWSYYSVNTNVVYDLPFSFPFYGDYYGECRVCAYGMIDFGSFYDYYYLSSYGIPSPNYENGMISAWSYAIGNYYSYARTDFKVFALQGETYGDRWVCFEWYKALAPGSYGSQPDWSQYEITFEVIIFESGLIKIQYLDADSAYSAYSNGNYGTVGIEDPTGSIGVMYSGYYDANLKSGLAIMFGKDLMEVSSVSVDTDKGGAMYAESRDYTVDALVAHPVNRDQLRVVSVSMGGFAEAVMYYNADGTASFSEIDPNGYLTVNSRGSTVEEDANPKYLRVKFRISPSLGYPVSFFQDLKVTAVGAGAMPGSYGIEDAYWVENKLDLLGSLEAYSSDGRFIENGGWVHGNERFLITGVRAVYPQTSVSPRPGAITFTITDEQLNQFVQDYVEESAEVWVTSENDLVRKFYNLSITNVPASADISSGFSYIINIDPFRPMPPEDIKIHADSYDDPNTEYDDDNEVYVSWEPAEDFESGIMGYYVATFDPRDEASVGEATWVQSPDTSARITFDDVGSRKVWVWSIDKAGNPSVPNYALTKIDAEEVFFSEFSPGHEIWVNTHTPVCSVLISDGEGSGVAAKDVQYSVSTTTTGEYSAWTPAKVPRDAAQLRVSVKTTFVNGKSNFIRFRAKDVAGNGWTYSNDYNVWVDEESPSFINFRPFETEYQNGQSVVVSLDITDIHGTREGSGVGYDSIEYRYSTGGKGVYGDWSPADVTSVIGSGVHLELELLFEEGIENYIQFRAYDDVGNFAQSREYNVRVNSAPDVVASLSDPVNGRDYTTSEKILFDGTRTTDPDGDVLGFSWYSDIEGFLSNSASFFKSLSAGVHEITLIVNDPAHSLVIRFDVTVYEEEQIDPESIDTDGDGIYDAWEIQYKLNPFRPDSFIDSDHDTFTNFQEFQNGTDPTKRISHPPYPSMEVESDDDETGNEQYMSVTVAVVLLSLVIILTLVLLAFSKRRAFLQEVEEEKELEAEEMDYRRTLDKRKIDRMNMK